MRSFLIATSMLFLLAGSAGCVESQPPVPTPLKTSNKRQKEIKNNQTVGKYTKQGTKDFPFVVQTLESESDAAEKDRNAKHREKESTNSRNTMLFTGGLLIVAVLQIGFFYWQLRLMRKNFKDTEKAANAARKSADALVMIERAYVFTSIKFINSYLSVHLKNHGKTPAILNSMYVTRKLSVPPPQEIDSRPKAHIPEGVVIGSNDSWVADVSPIIGDEEWELIESGEFRLFCYGVVEYTDILKQSRTTGFCWQYNFANGTGDWSIADSKLNYYDKNHS